MASNPQRRLHAAIAICVPNAHHNSLVTFQVSREVLSVLLNPPLRPRLVMIPAKVIVYMKGRSSDNGFVEVYWENRIHKIFEADLTRLVIQPS